MTRSVVVDPSRIAAFPIFADLPAAELDELAAAMTAQRTATVVARTPMLLLSLAGQDFDRIRDDHA